jgi:Domain of unknown function (DUF4349)
MKAIAIALLVCGLLISCSGEEQNPAPPATAATAPPLAPGQDEILPPRSLIHSVTLSVVASDSEAFAAGAEELAGSAGGYLETLTSAVGPGGRRYHMSLRVPAAGLDGVLSELRMRADEVSSEERETLDVTGRTVDLDARLRALGITQTQLEELLDESRAAGRDAEGIMTIFGKLSEIRERRESLLGQLAALGDKVALSRIDLSIAPPAPVGPVLIEWHPGRTFRNAVHALLLALRALATLTIDFIVVVIPVFGLLGLAGFGAYKLVRRLRA